MKDSDFIRSTIPMTKEEIRTIALSKLELKEDDTLMDIGAGTGSVSIEAALCMPKGKVIAIEQNEEAIELIYQNIQKHKLSNLKVIHAKAPESMVNMSRINKFFIGGSGGNLKQILDTIYDKSPKKSVIVVTAILLDTMYTAFDYFRKKKYDFELIQVSVNKIDPQKKVAMLSAQNPIFIITARRK